MTVDKVCGVVRAALGAGGSAAAAALHQHRVCGLALSVCPLADLKPIVDLPFGDWELFQLLISNLRELEATMPTTIAPAVNVIPEKPAETEPDAVKPPRASIEHQRSRPSNVEKQVTLEEQMICGALQTLNEEAMEDVLQSEPPSHPGEPLRTISESVPSLSPPPPASHLPPSPALSEHSSSDDSSDQEPPQQRNDTVVVNLTDDVFL